jgi:hypothetical protein
LRVKDEESDLSVATSGRDIILANKDVRLELVYRDGGYSQVFSGIDRAGHAHMVLSSIHRELIPLTEHRVFADPMFSGHRHHLFELSRESLRMVFSDAKVVESDDSTSVSLSGGNGGFDLHTTMTLYPGSKFVRVEVCAEFLESRRHHIFEYLMSAYAFLPDGALLDRYDRPGYAWTPCLRPEDDHIVGERSFSSAVVYVEHSKFAAAIIPEHGRTGDYPLALDLDLRNGLLNAPLLSCGFCDSEPDGNFSRHDCGMIFRPEPGRIAFTFWLYVDADSTARSAQDAVQQFLWQRASERMDYSSSDSIKVVPDVVSTAYLLKSRAKSRAESQRADQIIEQTLARQLPGGLFEREDNAGPRGFDTALTSGMCGWLLAIHRDFGGDLGVLAACRSYADFLLANQSASGAIPCWFDADLHALPELRDCAQTAASGRFLAEMHSATGERSYLTAANLAMEFSSMLAVRGRYLDSETFLAGAHEVRDAHTGRPAQGLSAMRHIADLSISMYGLTGETTHLRTGLAALGQMCWLQDTWSDRAGGFCPSNAFDGQASHAACARTLVEYYYATKRKEYLERALAALRAGMELGDPEAPAVQSWMVNTFGAALIDAREHTAYALGACRVDGLSIKPGRISFAIRNGGSPSLCVKFLGLRGNSYVIDINGEVKRYPKVELEEGIVVEKGIGIRE